MPECGDTGDEAAGPNPPSFDPPRTGLVPKDFARRRSRFGPLGALRGGAAGRAVFEDAAESTRDDRSLVSREEVGKETRKGRVPASDVRTGLSASASCPCPTSDTPLERKLLRPNPPSVSLEAGPGPPPPPALLLLVLLLPQPSPPMKLRLRSLPR